MIHGAVALVMQFCVFTLSQNYVYQMLLWFTDLGNSILSY